MTQPIRYHLIQPREKVANFIIDATEKINGIGLVVEERVAVTVCCGVGSDIVDRATLEIPNEEPGQSTFVCFVNVLEELVNCGVGN
jgi:hypothetical protein